MRLFTATCSDIDACLLTTYFDWIPRYEDICELDALVDCLRVSIQSLDGAIKPPSRDQKIYWRTFEKDHLELVIDIKINALVSSREFCLPVAFIWTNIFL